MAEEVKPARVERFEAPPIPVVPLPPPTKVITRKEVEQFEEEQVLGEYTGVYFSPDGVQLVKKGAVEVELLTKDAVHETRLALDRVQVAHFGRERLPIFQIFVPEGEKPFTCRVIKRGGLRILYCETSPPPTIRV